MIGSLYSGISGLKANTSAMGVIGDNIANVSTTGFKSSRPSFANVFSSTLHQTGKEIGRGVVMNKITAQWENGTFQNTTNPTDLAVNGTGMFIVADPNRGISYYTRAGQFDWGLNGKLLTPDGLVAQGYTIDQNGALSPLGDIQLPNGVSMPKTTTTISFGINLSSMAEETDTFSSAVTVYDSLGGPVNLNLTFTKTANPGEWTVDVVSDRIGSTATISETTFTFNDAGVMTVPTDDPIITVAGLAPAEDPLEISWTILNSQGVSDGSITSYASNSTRISQYQDGYPSGTLQSVTVDENGIFSGIYSNGSLVPFAQLALADFSSYSGLIKMSSNLYAESLGSGQPITGPANTASFGS
ncbi:flagellar hook-basal body complex protein, partial [Desulfosarcina sp. OttesenSCG-928-G10]|nr:flagellar hook-basal body complex protein [Desulfosarcina sp. OttesenSCG-928-G10]